MSERFFIPQPTPTGGQLEGFAAYAADGRTLKWSAAFPLPAIGSRIFIVMNNIGWAVVRGYFEAEGFLGVMTKATNPPKWLRDQERRELREDTHPTPGRRRRERPQWMKDGIGCEFGAEIELKRPKPVKKVEVAA